MRYLKKSPNSQVLAQDLRYRKDGKNTKIRDILRAEQLGFCAYSEAFLDSLSQAHIEHFDPRLKYTDDDNYWNWYYVLPIMNSLKGTSLPPEPLLPPHAPDVLDRINYINGRFVVKDIHDQATQNLIDFIGVNRSAVFDKRRKHIKRIKWLQETCLTVEEFWDALLDDPENLNFFSALQVEFGLPDELLDRLQTNP